MDTLNSQLKYSKDHVWLCKLDTGYFRIGITDYAQKTLGDILFVHIEAIESRCSAGKAFGTIESVKSASDVIMPVTGKLIGVNVELELNPEQVNQSCYDKGWLVDIEVDNLDDVAALLSEAEYKLILDD